MSGLPQEISEQSDNEIALKLRPEAGHVSRGVKRLLMAEGYSPISEFGLANGRRMDVAALGSDGTILGVEIKVRLADLRGDAKWRDYLGFCDLFYFAVPPDFPHGHVPEDMGLIVADRYGGAILRASARNALHASRRRAVTLRFARVAAERLAERDIPTGTGLKANIINNILSP